jgi:hypothetical protein
MENGQEPFHGTSGRSRKARLSGGHRHNRRCRHRWPLFLAVRANRDCSSPEFRSRSARRPPSSSPLRSRLFCALSVAVAFAIPIGMGAVIGRQVAQLGENLPPYQNVIAGKLETVRKSGLSAGEVETAADALHGLQNPICSSEEKAAVFPADRSRLRCNSQRLSPSKSSRAFFQLFCRLSRLH